MAHARSARGATRAAAATVRGIAITHAERPVWPGLTKLDLARYYDAIGEWLLPHLLRRPLTLVRCPDGTGGECFFQRHLAMGASPGDVRTFPRERGSRAPYLYVESVEAVISTVQHGAVEFHTSAATLPDISHPDRFTLDLDPGPGVAWPTLVQAAKLVKTLLDTLGLTSFVKTTGGVGLHVVAPIEPDLGWDELHAFTRRIAAALAKLRPELFVATMTKARRRGKVYVDHLRNAGEIRVAVAAYSARARPDAGVSTPLAWDELDGDDLRDRLTVRTIPRRLATLDADPWREYWTARNRITPRMRAALAAA